MDSRDRNTEKGGNGLYHKESKPIITILPQWYEMLKVVCHTVQSEEKIYAEATKAKNKIYLLAREMNIPPELLAFYLVRVHNVL